MQRLKEYGIIAAVTVLFMALVLVSVDTIYPGPQYDDFCNGNERRPMPTKLDSECSAKSVDIQAQSCYEQDLQPVFGYNESGCRVFQECSTCQKDYETANEQYSRSSFIIITILGVIAIVAGTLYSIAFIGTGFVAAGVLLVAWSTLRYFGDLSKPLRISLLFVELLVVLWVAKKKVAK